MMELEKMQQQWDALNQKLEKTELLNTKIIQDILQTRARSAHENLVKFEQTLLGVFLILIPFFFVFLLRTKTSALTIGIILGVFIFAIIWQAYKIYLLTKAKVDHLSVLEQTERISKYRTIIKYEYLLSGPIVLILIPLLLYTQGIPFTLSFAIRLGVVVLLTVGLVIYFYQLYQRKFNQIFTSLKELKEFSEKTDSES